MDKEEEGHRQEGEDVEQGSHKEEGVVLPDEVVVGWVLVFGQEGLCPQQEDAYQMQEDKDLH